MILKTHLIMDVSFFVPIIKNQYKKKTITKIDVYTDWI